MIIYYTEAVIHCIMAWQFKGNACSSESWAVIYLMCVKWPCLHTHNTAVIVNIVCNGTEPLNMHQSTLSASQKQGHRNGKWGTKLMHTGKTGLSAPGMQRDCL